MSMRICFFVITCWVVAIAAAATIVSPAEARSHHHGASVHHTYHHYARYVHHRGRVTPTTWACHSAWCGQAFEAPRLIGRAGGAHGVRARHERTASSVGMSGVSGTLAGKASEIVSSCGSTVISGFRPGARIAGSGHASMHASGRAVDIRGNPSCIYAHLQGWPGGYSVDYGAVQHVHISLGGREDGLRFRHYAGHASHYAHHAAYGGHHRRDGFVGARPRRYASHGWPHRI